MVKESNWWEWDQVNKRFDYSQTLDHVFAPYSAEAAKRIGDMDRDELIHVIATGYHDRERLAAAILWILAWGDTPEPQTDHAIDLAKAIMRRVEGGAK